MNGTTQNLTSRLGSLELAALNTGTFNDGALEANGLLANPNPNPTLQATCRTGPFTCTPHIDASDRHDDGTLEAQSAVSLSPTHGGCHTHSVRCDLGMAECRQPVALPILSFSGQSGTRAGRR